MVLDFQSIGTRAMIASLNETGTIVGAIPSHVKSKHAKKYESGSVEIT